MISIILAFLFLAMIGLFQDNPLFKLPAAAGILLLFSILIAASGGIGILAEKLVLPGINLVFICL